MHLFFNELFLDRRGADRGEIDMSCVTSVNDMFGQGGAAKITVEQVVVALKALLSLPLAD